MPKTVVKAKRKARAQRAETPPVAYCPDLPDESQLIFEDGEPLESDWHVLQIYLLHEVVSQLFEGRTDFFCGGNMFIYFSEEQVESVRQQRPLYKGPDFFVVKDVDGLKPRKGWVVWKEGGRYPDVIFELVSPTTTKKDKQENLALYSKTFGTEEYFWYDPDIDELKGFRLVDGDYVPIEPNEQGWLWSNQLGAYVGVWEGVFHRRRYRWVRLFRADGFLVLTSQERAEQERQRAEQERQRAERLAQRLRELGIEPEE